MKYILTEDEYNALINKVDNVNDQYFRDVQQLCIEVAVHKPIPLFGKDQPHVKWGCILADDPEQQAEVCDECPVVIMCPYDDKIWSK